MASPANLFISLFRSAVFVPATFVLAFLVTFAASTAHAQNYSINDVSMNEGMAGPTVVTFTITRSASGTAETVQFDTADGTATSADSDYVPIVAQTVSFGVADTIQTVNVTVNGDARVELDEIFNGVISAPSGAGVITDGSGDATITNDDSATISINDVAATEGGTLSFSLSLSAQVDTAITLNADANDSSATVANGDYTDATTPISFPANSVANQTFNIVTTDDNIVELVETLTADLSGLATSGRSVSILDAQGIGTLNDNDQAQISINDVSIVEGDAGTTNLDFTVTIDTEVDSTVTLDYTTADGTAVNTADFTTTTANDTAFPLTGSSTAAGETITISVPIVGEQLVELDENFLVNLSDIMAGGRNVVFLDNSGTGTINNDDTSTLTIASVTANEGNAGTTTFTFTVSADLAVDVPYTVDYQTFDDTALAGSDYTAASGTLNFAGTAAETQTFDVDVTGDAIAELDEIFETLISNVAASGRSVVIGDADATGTIINDDNAELTINDVTLSEGNAATTIYTFTVSLSGDVDTTFSVDYASTNDTAVSGTDYTAGSGTLNFAGTDGETQTFNISVNGDTTVELDETFFVDLSNVLASGRDVIISDSRGIGSVTNDDSATIMIDDITLDEGDAGTTAYTFTVTLSADVDTAVSLSYASTDNTATTADSDYTSASGTLNFVGTSGETQTLTVNVNGDTVIEPDESFFVNLSAIVASGRDVSFTDSQGLGTVTNDDTATLDIADVTMAEGNAGNTVYTFNVELTGEVAGAFTVDYTTTDGTATTANSDYTAASGVLTFSGVDGETQAITVNVTGDQIVELDETFTIDLSNIQAGGLSVAFAAGGDQADANITNDDSATVSIDDVTLTEGDAGTTNASFTISIDNAVDSAVGLDITTTDGTASSLNDYVTTAVAGQLFPGAGTTAAGATITIDVPVNGDEVVELDENFTLDLSNLVAGGRDVTFADNQGLGTITNDDQAQFSISDVTAVETNAGTTNFTFVVTLDSTVDVNVQVTAESNDGTAVDASDYGAFGPTALTFFAGAAPGATQNVIVAVNGDTLVELDETFTIDLSGISATGRDVIFADSQGLGTITNDDAASIAISDVTLNEGNAGTTSFTFTTTLTGAVDSSFTVDYATADGTATTAGSDYIANSGTLTFAGTNGETQTFTVDVNGDVTLELSELFTANLSNLLAGGRAVTISDASANGNIVNDDGATFVIDDVSLTEGNAGNTSFTFTVTLTGTVASTVMVDYATADSTATLANNDYIAESGTLTFAGTAGETQTITVDVPGDTVLENDEIFLVNLSNIVDGGTGVTFADSQGDGTILNDDAASISIADVTANETNAGTTTFTFTATLNNDVSSALSVDYATSDGSATTAAGDYIATSGTLNFAGTAGETQTFNVVVNGDATVELDEVFTATLSNVVDGGQGVTISDATADGTISNDDQAQLSIDDVSMVEGNAGTLNYVYTVSLDSDVDVAVQVDIDTVDGTATAADSDFAAISNTVLFPANSGPGATDTQTVVVSSDTKVELDEAFSVLMSNIQASGRNVVFADASGAGTITNDDSATITIADITNVEGNAGTSTFDFIVTLDAEVDTAISLTFTTDLGSATYGDNDFEFATGTVNFTGSPAGETQTVSITVNGDTKVELDETFFVDINNLNSSGRSVTIADARARGTITNDDAASIAIDDITQAEGDLPGTTQFNFTVTLTGEVDSPFNVDYATANNTATAGDSDYIANSGTITFVGSDGETANISVIVNHDDKVELDESFFVNLSNLVTSGRNVTIADSQGVGTISNDDQAAFSIDDVSIVEGNFGTSNIVFTVTLDTAVDVAVDVDFVTADDSAAAVDSDYTVTTGTLNFTGTPAGEQLTISVPVLGDNKVELDQTFFVNLSNIQASGRNVVFGDNQGVGTITNDDEARLFINDVTLLEGDAGTTSFVFSITLDQEVDTLFDVDFTSTDGTATAGSDYTTNSGTLTYNGVQGEVMTVTVVATGDEVVELTENFLVDLSNIQAGGRNVIFLDAQGEGTLTNDDSATIAIGDVSVIEGDAGTTAAVFNVTLSEAVDVPITIDFATVPGSAEVVTNDYVFSNGSLTFAGTVGEVQTVSVPVNGDEIVELDELFTVDLTNLNNSGRNVSVSDATGFGTIINDDMATVDIGDVTQAETDAPGTTTFNFVVTLSDAVQDGLTVDFATADGLAIEGSGDYNGANGTLTFLGAAGETANVSVTVNGDDVVELDETFFVNLSNLLSGGKMAAIGDAQGDGLITNDEQAQFSIDDVTVTEGLTGTVDAVFTITLDTAVDVGVDVDFTTTDGTATDADSDFTAISGTLSFAATSAGETMTVTVSVNGDETVELDEDYTVDLSNIQASGRDVVFADDSGLGTITNDDAALITIADVSQNEGTGGTTNYVFTLSMSRPVDVAVDVDTDSSDGTATVADLDYTALSVTTTFPAGGAGVQTQTQTVVVNADNKVEFDDSFFVDLTNIMAMGRDVTFGDAQAEGTIVNDDSATIVIDDVSQNEGNAGTSLFTFTVTLSNPTAVGISVDYATADGVAKVADGDYAAASGSINFVGNATNETQTIDVTVNGDTIFETDEIFLVNLSNLMNGGLSVSIGDAQGTGTILNDDTNNLPVAVDESYTTDEDTKVTVAPSGLLMNDTDVDMGHQAALAVVAFDAISAQGAVVIVNPDGSFTYDPTGSKTIQRLALGEVLVDTFTYTVEDPEGGQDVGTVTVTIDGLFDPLTFAWNGFINIQNIVTIFNPSDTNAAVARIVLFDIDGIERSSVETALAPGQNADVIINDLPGFGTDTYGLVKIFFDANRVDGRGTYFRFNPDNPDVIDFEIALQLEEGQFGDSFVNWNTFSPSLAENSVANFLTIINDDDTANTFIVDLVDDAGNVISTRGLTLPPSARADIQAGHENPGPDRIGLVHVQPVDQNARYFTQVTRYGLTADNELTSFAAPTTGKVGSTDTVYAPISRGGNANNYVALSSASDVTQDVEVKFYDNVTGLTGTQTVTLPPRAQVNIFANPFVTTGISGMVKATSLSGKAIFVESSVYFIENNAVTASYIAQARADLSQVAFAGYNTFLNQFNQLKLFNTTLAPMTVNITVSEIDGTVRGSETIILGAERGTDLSLESLSFGLANDTAGRVKVEAPGAGQLVSEILQVRPIPNAGGFTIDATASVPMR